MLHVKINLSIAFHLQNDGQTKWLNQIVEQYLCCIINYHQDDWIELLSFAKFTYNKPNMPSYIIFHFLQIIDVILNLTLSIFKMMFLILLLKTLQYKCKLFMKKFFLILKKFRKYKINSDERQKESLPFKVGD